MLKYWTSQRDRSGIIIAKRLCIRFINRSYSVCMSIGTKSAISRKLLYLTEFNWNAAFRKQPLHSWQMRVVQSSVASIKSASNVMRSGKDLSNHIPELFYKNKGKDATNHQYTRTGHKSYGVCVCTRVRASNQENYRRVSDFFLVVCFLCGFGFVTHLSGENQFCF